MNRVENQVVSGSRISSGIAGNNDLSRAIRINDPSHADKDAYKVDLSEEGKALQARDKDQAGEKGTGETGQKNSTGLAEETASESKAAENSGDGEPTGPVEQAIQRIKEQIRQLKEQIAALEGNESEASQKQREALQKQVQELTRELISLVDQKMQQI